MLDAPFVLNRRVCELPLIPSAVSNFCVTGMATVQLGASRNDQFFCSQFVLEAYNQAGAPITTADPRWVSPGRPAAHARRRRAVDPRDAAAALCRPPQVQPAAGDHGGRSDP